MRAFVLFTVLAVAFARPEAPGGYNYNSPGHSAGAVSPTSHGASGYDYNRPQQVSNGHHSAGGFSGAGGFGGHGGAAGGVSGGFANGGGFSSGGGAGFGQGGGFSSGGGAGFGGGFGGGQQQQTIVQKHIYVHVPPPEEEAAVAQQQQQLAAPRKHYKIIFIKAPSAPSITQQIAAAQAQNEEKTLIYVLVKKPEDLAAGPGPAPVASLPVSKPEVYFIKYKTQKDASAAAGAASGGFGSTGSGFSGASSSGNGFGSGSSIGSGPADFQVSNPSPSYGTPFKK